MRSGKLWAVALVTCVWAPVACAGEGFLKNPSFEHMRGTQDARKRIAEWRHKGWQFGAGDRFPTWWNVNPATGKGKVEVVRGNAQHGHTFLRLDDTAHVTGNFGLVTRAQPYVVTMWLRGKGHFELWLYQYRKDPKRIYIGPRVAAKLDIDTAHWTQFCALYANAPSETFSVHVALSGKGPIDVDNLSMVPATPAQALIAETIGRLYGKEVLVENASTIAVDPSVRRRVAETRAALAALAARKDTVNPSLLRELRQIAKRIDELARPGGRVLAHTYNELFALRIAAGRLAREEAHVAKVAPPGQAPPRAVYRAGIRAPRPGRVTILKARPNKILYEPGETAVVPIQVINGGARSVHGTLVCRELRGLDSAREIARVDVALRPKERRTVRVRYNVGEDEFGRELEVRFEAGGEVLDRWSEYYSVAADWLRVASLCGWVPEGPHDHSRIAFYGNMAMTHGTLPCHTCYSAPREVRWCAQYGRPKRQSLRAGIRASQRHGIKRTSYTHTSTLNDAAGLEFARRHPQWVKRDRHGRFARFEFYGGLTPAPLEIAAGWQQPRSRWMGVMTLLLDEKLIRTLANNIADSAEMFGWDGIMFDGPPALSRGWDYQGREMPAGLDPAEVSARNIRIYREVILKRVPKFKMWFNYGYTLVSKPFDHPFGAYGGERQFAEAMATPGTAMLLEQQQAFFNPKSRTHRWRYCYHNLYLSERDNVVQRYKVPVLTGWMWQHIKGDQPGPHRWAWTATNHIGALLLATQMHPVTWASPAWRPIYQFMTRYSALLYAKDVVVVQNPERFVSVKASRPLWWKEVVYTRPAPGGQADLIIHLINEPVTETIEFENPADPPPANGTTVTLKGRHVVRAWAVRPYHYDEPQQVVTSLLTLTRQGDGVAATVPPFHYYTMVVLRLRD